MASNTGTPGDDNLPGTPDSELITGLDGNDNIIGNGGQDTLRGDGGNDHILFGPSTGPGAAFNDTSSDLIFGGLGSDTIQPSNTGSTGPLGFNTIYGGTGDATQDAADGSNSINLIGDRAADIVFAGGGGDKITLGLNAGSSVIGGVGNDTVVAPDGSSSSLINGNLGNDLITATSGNGGILHGGRGFDTINISAAIDSTTNGTVLAADLDDDLVNDDGFGNDTLYGGRGNDSINIQAPGGGPTINTGNIEVFGGTDADLITVSNAGRDTIFGGTDTTGVAADGNNTINATASAGRDLLVGGGGNDLISASTKDFASGAAAENVTATTAFAPGANVAVDTLTGGGGNDTFSFNADATGLNAAGNVFATDINGVDSVSDFISGSDKFSLANVGVPTSVGPASSFAQALANAQTGTNGLASAANLVLGQDEKAATPGFAEIFNYNNSNFLVVDKDGGQTFNGGDYLINVGTVTNLKQSDFV